MDNSTITPYIATTTGQFDGNDGNWSTFTVAVGTPPQFFRLLPAIVDNIITIPVPEGCADSLANWSSCGASRGVEWYNGAASRGFQYEGSSASSTFQELGIHNIYPYQDAYPLESGLFGLDTVTISQGTENTTVALTDSMVAGISTADFWLGSIGLGVTPLNINQSAYIAPSLLSRMKSDGLIPSLSFSYTAGQAWVGHPGSLILGGLDLSRQGEGTITTPVNMVNTMGQLVLELSDIRTSHMTGQIPALEQPLTVSIDSSLSHMWLPGEVCDFVAASFGLTYDEALNFYLLNDSQHSVLKASNATLTVVLGGNTSSGSTSINLEYASLDVSAGPPLFDQATNYFPMRRADASMQSVLGRVFLQQAYLVVDWERQNFSIGPLAQDWTQDGAVMTIEALTASSVDDTFDTSQQTSDRLSIAGILGGALSLLALLIVAAVIVTRAGQRWFASRARTRDVETSTDMGGTLMERTSTHTETSAQTGELDGSPVTEMPAEPLRRPELPDKRRSSQAFEIAASKSRRIKFVEAPCSPGASVVVSPLDSRDCNVYRARTDDVPGQAL